jgi:hypothetical protein
VPSGDPTPKNEKPTQEGQCACKTGHPLGLKLWSPIIWLLMFPTTMFDNTRGLKELKVEDTWTA